MSDSAPTDLTEETSLTSSSDEDNWATPYESEFDMTLSDIDEELLEAMRNFDINDARPPVVAPQPAIHDDGDSAGDGDDTTRYSIANGGTTAHWSEAAHAQRQGSHVQAVVKRHKYKLPKTWFVVIVGRPPGLYAANEVEEHVTGTTNAVYQGYPTRQIAELAWITAQQAGLVGSPEGHMPPNFILDSLPLESQHVPAPSPLSAPGAERRFYVVFRGRFTGIFDSSLESGLSVASVPGNAHESCRSYFVASRRYRYAQERGTVAVIEE